MKIGIITTYHNSINYGGNLQAYALCKTLKNKGYEVEQIQYKSENELVGKIEVSFLEKIKNIIKVLFRKTKNLFKGIRYKYIYKKNETEFLSIIDDRRKAFYHFNQIIIPHSKEVYNAGCIKDCSKNYDAFITGSDQVWNLAWYNSAYFLNFVPEGKRKISYAASISMDSFSEEQEELVKKNLKGYHAISVREESAVDLLKNLTENSVNLVVDPTLLLDEQEWKEICADRVVEEQYVFFYFLGNNVKARKVATQFARLNNLKIIEIPYAAGSFNVDNISYGDIKLTGVSPEKFLSLIKNAEAVFTDSFHAIVFSFIFKKQFYVFNRDKQGSMNTRIKNMTKLLGLENRFCADKSMENTEYINSLGEIDYSKEFKLFEDLRKKSYDFLTESLK